MLDATLLDLDLNHALRGPMDVGRTEVYLRSVEYSIPRQKEVSIGGLRESSRHDVLLARFSGNSSTTSASSNLSQFLVKLGDYPRLSQLKHEHGVQRPRTTGGCYDASGVPKRSRKVLQKVLMWMLFHHSYRTSMVGNRKISPV